MATETLYPIARHYIRPAVGQPGPQREPSNLLRTLIGVSLGAAAAMAVDVTPLVRWFLHLV